MSESPVLGGVMPTHEGLRYVPVNARAMGYSAAAVSVARPGGWSPLPVGKRDAEEYRKMTRGIATYVLLPPEAAPCPGRGWDERRRAYLGHLRAASQLGAAGVVVPPIRVWANGSDPSEGDILEDLRRFYAAPLDSLGLNLYFRLGRPGSRVSEPGLLSRAFARGEFQHSGRFWLALDPGSESLDWDDARIEATCGGWGRRVRLLLLSAERESLSGASGLFRRLAGIPVILEHCSLAEQGEVAQWLRETCEDPDVFDCLP